MDPRVGYCTPFFLAAILIFIVALFSYRRRRVRGAWYLTFICLAASFWAVTEGLLYLGLDIKNNILMTKLQYLGIAPLSPLTLLFVISFFGFESWITRKKLLILFLIAMTIIILVWTNSLHNLIYTEFYTIDSGPFPMLGLKHGLMWWIIIIYHYLLLAMLSIVLLGQVFTSAGLHRSQAGIMMAAVSIVWVVNAVYVSGNSPVPNMDISPIAFTLVAGAMALGFFRYSLLDILPVAKEEIFRGLDDAILVLDEKDRVIDMNPAAESIFNIGVTEIIGREARQVFGDYPQLHELPDESKQAEVCMIIAGHERVYDIHISALSEKKGAMLGRVIALRNVTERKRAEEALRESEEKLFRSKKMESLGLLAGGVAHDLNNVLSGIVGYPELLLFDLPEDSKLRKPIETIQESGQKAVDIVQDLLTVARGVATTKEPLNLNALVGDYLNSPEFKKLKQFHPTVMVKTNLDSDLFNVSGSHVHISKVVMNLISNASEAFDGSGNVIVSTMNRYVDRPLRGYDDVNTGEYVVLSVSDNGSGISSDGLERIFEPFYTKKVMGRSGTGLGLAVVWNVIQDHEGYINVTSDENGTTFELYFPITRDEVSYKDLDIPIEDFKGDGETILAVDDVETQRDIACKMLKILGYKAKAVSSGEEAVEYLKEHTVDLILLDMIMDPGINGRETYERIIKIHPNQKAIIASGFAETDDVKETQKLGAGKYIKKPLSLKKMGLAIKEELEK